jgi:sigma-B regulation protein RsbU (phosphoserine phosphatase)
MRRGRKPEPLWEKARRQPALGLLESALYTTCEDTLEAGDALLLYTDGIVEAESPEGVEFGVERLAKSFAASLASGSLRDLPRVVIGDLTRHVDTSHFEDDVCLVAVEARPAD